MILLDSNITCCYEGGLPGQQPVLGSSDHFREVCSGGSHVFYLLLHGGQYLQGDGGGGGHLINTSFCSPYANVGDYI